MIIMRNAVFAAFRCFFMDISAREGIGWKDGTAALDSGVEMRYNVKLNQKGGFARRDIKERLSARTALRRLTRERVIEVFGGCPFVAPDA